MAFSLLPNGNGIKRGDSFRALSDTNLPRQLAVRLPVRLLPHEHRIVHRRLDLSGGVDGPRDDGVLAGSGARPVEVPELPGVGFILPFPDRRPAPVAVVDPYLDAIDRSAPGGAVDPKGRTLFRHLRRHGLDESAADGGHVPDGLGAALFLAQGHV